VSEHPSRFTLALRDAGDLGPAEAAFVDAHLAACPACRAAADEIERDCADYGSRAEAERARLMAALANAPQEIETARRSRRAVGIGVAAVALAAAAAIALVVVVPRVQEGARGPDRIAPEDVGFKGALAVRIVAKRGEKQFAVRQGEALEAGDALRFVVTASEPGWIAVLSVEATGGVSVFYPAADPWPLRIDDRGRRELPGSIILDDARGAETYVVLYSTAPFSREAAGRAADALSKGRDELPDGLEGSAIRVRKVARGGT